MKTRSVEFSVRDPAHDGSSDSGIRMPINTQGDTIYSAFYEPAPTRIPGGGSSNGPTAGSVS